MQTQSPKRELVTPKCGGRPEVWRSFLVVAGECSRANVVTPLSGSIDRAPGEGCGKAAARADPVGPRPPPVVSCVFFSELRRTAAMPGSGHWEPSVCRRRGAAPERGGRRTPGETKKPSKKNKRGRRWLYRESTMTSNATHAAAPLGMPPGHGLADGGGLFPLPSPHVGRHI